jgi:hypothetical protein
MKTIEGPGIFLAQFLRVAREGFDLLRIDNWTSVKYLACPVTADTTAGISVAAYNKA